MPSLGGSQSCQLGPKSGASWGRVGNQLWRKEEGWIYGFGQAGKKMLFHGGGRWKGDKHPKVDSL